MPLMAPKPLPPRWMRRMVLAPAMIGLTVTLLLTLPIWLLVAAAASPLLPGRLRALRVLWVVLVWLVLESACLLALFGLWLASGFGALTRTPPFQRVHYRLVGGYLWVFHRAATRVLGLRVEVEGPDPDEYLGRPLLVFCRHAGPGDSFLLMHALVNWYAREPRIVLAAALQWDPAIDVVLNRLPNRFLSTGGHAVERQIGALATALDGDDAFVIFPEGGNFTERRRAAGHRPVAGARSRRGGPALGGDAPRAAAAARRCRRGADGRAGGRRRVGRARRARPPVHRRRRLARAAARRPRPHAVVAGAGGRGTARVRRAGASGSTPGGSRSTRGWTPRGGSARGRRGPSPPGT